MFTLNSVLERVLNSWRFDDVSRTATWYCLYKLKCLNDFDLCTEIRSWFDFMRKKEERMYSNILGIARQLGLLCFVDFLFSGDSKWRTNITSIFWCRYNSFEILRSKVSWKRWNTGCDNWLNCNFGLLLCQQ